MITLQQIKSFLNPFKGATASSNGIKGLVPTPKIGDENKFLQGSGIWEEVDLSPLKNDITELSSTITDLQSNKSNITADNINVANYLTKLGFTGTNKATNGYYKMPDGIIIQWGTGTNLATSTFPITFPAKVCAIIGTRISGGYEHSLIVTSYTTSNFYMDNRGYNNGTGAGSFWYIAIGY